MKLVSSNSLKHSSCLCRSKYKILIALIFGVVISACDSGDQIADPEVAGFIYTSTNGEATNQVLKLER